MPVVQQKKQMDVLKTVKQAAEDPSAFLQLMEKHNSKQESFDIFEYVQVLSKKNQGQLWDLTLLLVQSSIQRLRSAEDAELASQDLEVLFGVCVFVRSAMSQDKPAIVDSLLTILQALHDVLLALPDESVQLQDEISSLCEDWWHCDFPGKESLVPHSVVCLLSITLCGDTPASSIKRMYSFRQALLLLEFNDDSADSLKCLLVTCFIHPSYLRCEEGRKFLSFLFGLNPEFVLNIHTCIKNQIPTCPKALLDIYGEVYFRAWKASSGVYLQVIEEQCIQDLMYRAVHAPRSGLRSLFSAARRVLGYLHRQCGQRGVTDMLYRLYKPFLWRSLKVANADVRANAACLFLDAFPLQDTECPREERHVILQKQFDILKDLLEESSVTVRPVAVAGVCRVLEGYWEIVPPAVVRGLLRRLVADLSRDASSVNVRVAVMQGLCILLENHLSQPVLKDLLPLLGGHIHDTSERVRIALLELLILVKNMKAIKFWEVVPLDQLLLRLEVDSAPVARRIVALLIDSFQPSHQDKQERLERCVALIKSNPTAARKFYQQALKHLSTPDIGRFILSVNKCLLRIVETSNQPSAKKAPNRKQNGNIEASSKEEEEEKEQREVEESEEEDELTVKDTVVLAGLLETLVILMEGCREQLEKPCNKQVKTKVVASLTNSVPLFFATFQDEQSRSATILLASHLPYKNVSNFGATFLEVLRTMDASTPASGGCCAAMLEALVMWGRAQPLLGMLHSWLEHTARACPAPANEPEAGPQGPGQQDDTHPQPKRRGKKTAPRKKTESEPTAAASEQSPARPQVAAEFVKMLLVHPLCLRELLPLKQFWNLKAVLKECLHHLDSSLLGENGLQPRPYSNEVLRELFELHCRMVLLQVTQEKKNEESFCEDMEDLLGWCGSVLGRALSRKPSASSDAVHGTSRPRRKRNVAALPVDDTAGLNELTLNITEVALNFFGEVLLAGVFPLELRTPLSRMVSGWMTSSYGPSLVRPSSKLVYQLADSWCEPKCQDKTPSVLVDNEDLLESLLNTTSRSTASRGEEHCSKVLAEMRPVLTAALEVSVQVFSLPEAPLCPRPPLVERMTGCALRHLTDCLRVDPGRKWPSDVQDLPCFARTLTELLCHGAVTKRFFWSHLISIPSKPKPDVDFKDQALNFLSILHLVSSLLQTETEAGMAQAVNDNVVAEIEEFMECLSDEHVESLGHVLEIMKNGCEIVQTRASL